MRRIILLLLIFSIVTSCTKETEPVACTLDVKVCPDGSTVGRVPPDCEFASCPEVEVTGEITESISEVDTVDGELDNQEVDTELDNLEEDLSNW